MVNGDPRLDRFWSQVWVPGCVYGMRRGWGWGWGWGVGVGVGGWALVHCRSICALCRKVVKISAVYVRNEWQNWISCEERGRWQAKEREGWVQTKCQQTILVNFTSANIIQMVINCNNNDRAKRMRERGGMRHEEASGGSWRLTEAATTRQGQNRTQNGSQTALKVPHKWIEDSNKKTKQTTTTTARTCLGYVQKQRQSQKQKQKLYEWRKSTKTTTKVSRTWSGNICGWSRRNFPISNWQMQVKKVPKGGGRKGGRWAAEQLSRVAQKYRAAAWDICFAV